MFFSCLIPYPLSCPNPCPPFPGSFLIEPLKSIEVVINKLVWHRHSTADWRNTEPDTLGSVNDLMAEMKIRFGLLTGQSKEVF